MDMFGMYLIGFCSWRVWYPSGIWKCWGLNSHRHQIVSLSKYLLIPRKWWLSPHIATTKQRLMFLEAAQVLKLFNHCISEPNTYILLSSVCMYVPR